MPKLGRIGSRKGKLGLLLVLCGRTVVARHKVQADPSIVRSLHANHEHRVLQEPYVPLYPLDDGSPSLADLSEQLEQLSILVQAMQNETAASIKADVNKIQSSTTEAMENVKADIKSTLTEERKVILREVQSLVEDFEGELKGLQQELEVEAAVLLTELEVSVRKMGTIGSAVIAFLLLIAMTCGCGCGACVIFLTTQRVKKMQMESWQEEISEGMPLNSAPTVMSHCADSEETADIFRDEDGDGDEIRTTDNLAVVW